MADDANEDSWLYGTSNPDSTTNEEERVGNEAPNIQAKDNVENEAAALQAEPAESVIPKEEPQIGEEGYEDPAEEMEEDEDAAVDTTDNVDSRVGEDAPASDDDEDDSDDDINVVIGDIKSAPATFNIKQRALTTVVSGADKSKTTQGGKFMVEDFDAVGTINGVPAHEFSIDSLEDKPWRKPGADITDYFNYGFNEETWRAYCERQKRIRVVESGVGLASLTQNQNPGAAERHHEIAISQHGSNIPIPISSAPADQMHMPPPGLISSPSTMGHPPPRMGIMHPRGPRPITTTGSKENAIQVMTAECREYSRPGVVGQMPPPNFAGPPPGSEEPFFPENTFDYGYEPTQESQWGNDNSGWVPGIKELTPGPGNVPPSHVGPGMPPQPIGVMGGPPPQMRPPMMGGMPPPNMAMGPPHPMTMMMGMRMPIGPPHRMPSHNPQMQMDRERHDRDRDRERESRRDERRDERQRDRESYSDRRRDKEKSDRGDDNDEERDRRRRERERERERDRDRERSRRDRSRSREKSRRRSKSREKERKDDRKDRDKERDKDRDKDREKERDKGDKERKKKSHRKDKKDEE